MAKSLFLDVIACPDKVEHVFFNSGQPDFPYSLPRCGGVIFQEFCLQVVAAHEKAAESFKLFSSAPILYMKIQTLPYKINREVVKVSLRSLPINVTKETMTNLEKCAIIALFSSGC